MAGIQDLLLRMKQNPKGIRFSELCKVYDYYFGRPRQASGSHRVYKMPWQGDPRINLQNHQGMAKAYQVKQALLAIQMIEDNHGSEK